MKILMGVAILIILALFAGCTQPSSQESENTTPNTTTTTVTTTPHEDIAFSPLVTSDAYVAPQKSTTQPSPSSKNPDPLVGSWKYSGDKYQCDVIFSHDNTGYVSCYFGLIQLGSRTFKWSRSSIPTPYSGMQNYSISETNSDKEYVLLYSERNNGVSSDLIPDQGYLVKVN